MMLYNGPNDSLLIFDGAQMKPYLPLLLALSLAACGDSDSQTPDSPNNTNGTNNQTTQTNNQTTTNNGSNNGSNNTIAPEFETARSELSRVTSPNLPAGHLEQLVDGNTEFALDLLKQVGPAEAGNLVFSPHSISTALGMTHAGARNATETAIASTMHYTLPQADLHPAFNALALELESRGQGASASDGTPFKLNINNALWLRTGTTFEPAFLDVLGQYYGAGVNLLNFPADADGSRIIINEWVADQTEDMIQDLLAPNSITPDTVAVLTNAIYFNASWRVVFPEDSPDATFTLGDGTEISVPTMSQMESFGHVERADYHMVELPYDGQEVSFVALLPKNMSVQDLESGLTATELSDAFGALQTKTVDLSMPKFKFETPLGLGETLQTMGMGEAFSANADFSGMTPDLNLAIGDVIHKAIIDVNEKGTEAAAATAVIIVDTSVPVADVELDLNRPFLFLIRDVETNAILFLGRLADPR